VRTIASHHNWKGCIDERCNRNTRATREPLRRVCKRVGNITNTERNLRLGASWDKMEPYMQESLDLICNKLARIVNGDPFYDDSWHDVGGYAKLVEIELAKGK
jgi:hypothetical protein